MYRLLMFPAGFLLLALMWGPVAIAAALEDKKSKNEGKR
jgi:hypothetical protein